MVRRIETESVSGFIHEPGQMTKPVGLLGAYRRLWSEITGEWRRDRNVVYYLIASAVFRDGVTGVVTFGAVLGVNVYGISEANVLLFGVGASVIAAVGAALGGLLDDRVGSKPVIVGSLIAMIGVAVTLMALSGAPAFYTLYEVRDRTVLSSPAYLERLNSPTEWTTRSVAHFRNTSRSLCDAVYSSGSGSGGVIGTIRFDCDPAHDATVLVRLTQDVLPGLLAATGIAAAHVCRADLEVSKVKTAEQKGRAENLVPRWVVMLEGSQLEPVQAALSGPLGPAALATAHVPQAVHGVYRLEFDLLK